MDFEKFYEDLFQHHNGDNYDDVNDYENDMNQQDVPQEFSKLTQNIFDAIRKKPSCDLKRLISEECGEIQRNEMIALKAIFENDLQTVDDKCKCYKITITEKSMGFSEDQVINLWFSVPVNYPNEIPIFEVEGHGGLSLTKADQLYEILLEESYKRKHETMIYDLVIIAKEFVANHIPVEETKAEDEKGNSEDPKNSDNDEKNVFYYSPHINLRPSMFTGPIHKLLERIPQNLQIVCIENILKPDLVEKYKACKDHFAKRYAMQSRKTPETHIIEPCLGFHGTRKSNMPNIVRTGLQVPGNESGVQVAHGSYYGVGIYLSPSPAFSLNYSDDNQTLLVCSVLLGHCIKYGSYKPCRGSSNFDSALSPCGEEMVIFNAAQVLPCFILRLMNKASKHEKPTLVQGGYASTIEKTIRKSETPEEKKARVKRRADKWLPHGYGASNKIEDIADSDDDEEEYGEYQTYRYETSEFSEY